MSIINSAPSFNQYDSDITMINHSLLYDGNDEPIQSCIPIVRRLQQANHAKSVDTKQDYIYINHDLSETIKQLEQILNYYRQDLKQESNTQYNCNQQLITRLIDLIRPVYSSENEKIKDLDVLFNDISQIHEKRFLEQKEKNDQLCNKIRHLQKSFISIPMDDDDDANNNRDSLINNIHRMNTMFDYEEWLQLEEETKKLQNLVERQREQIDILIELLKQTELTNNDQASDVINTLDVKNNKEKKCGLCDYTFPHVYSQAQIIEHVENCSSSTSNIVDKNLLEEIKHLACPYCNENLSNINEFDYNQHLEACFNEMTGNF